jgi:hypothetical protein
MSDTAIIIQLRETINRTENMVPFMQLDMLDLLVSVQSEIETLTEKNAQLRKERDEARREVCDWYHTDESGCVKYGSWETAIDRGWDCFKKEETL